MNNRPTVTQEMLENNLAALGVQAGDLLVVHSSLSSLGWVEGGEHTVIEALLECLGPQGTLFMPALSLGYFGPRRPPPLFDPATTASVVGRIPESFRRRPESTAASIRRIPSRESGRGPMSCSATTSVRGRHAVASRRGGESLDDRGKVLMLGVGTAACTMFHGPEEEAEPDARCGPRTPCRIVLPGGEGTFFLRLHRPYHGAVSNRRGMHHVLRERGLTSEGRVGGAAATLIDARGLWEVSMSLLRARPSGRVDAVHARLRRAAEQVLLRR